MIFKRFFTPKHQHQDAAVRLAAIDELNAVDPKQKQALHELAFNDADAKVSIKALQKLDSFPLWNKAAQTASLSDVKRRAKKQVESSLLAKGGATALAKEERETYLKECSDKTLLESVLKADDTIQDNVPLTLEILERLEKPQLTKQLLQQSTREPLQLALFEKLNQQASLSKTDLQKLHKKVSSQSLLDRIAKELDVIELKATKPPAIIKDTKLVLSKMLAVKDEFDFERAMAKVEQSKAAFEALVSEFSWLEAEDSASFHEKYASIQNALAPHLDNLKTEWDKQSAQREFQQRFDDTLFAAKSLVSNIAEHTAAYLKESIAPDFASLALHLKKAKEDLDSLAKSDDWSADMRSKIEKQYSDILRSEASLDTLPQIKERIEKSQAIVTKALETPIPAVPSELDSAKSFLHDIEGEWRTVISHDVSIWPSEIVTEFKGWRKTHKAALDKLYSQRTADEQRCRGKIKAIGQLVSQGRYRAAIGVFAKATEMYNALAQSSQKKLAKSFEEAQQEIDNLKDLQQYIAAPRRPALLEQANELASDSTPSDISERAKAVKQLRQDWNSLGRVSDGDAGLNTAFEQALEKAFAPCREHFDAQQKRRNENLAARQKIIAEMQELAEMPEGSDVQAIEKSFSSLTRAWRETGEVDRKEKDALFGAYNKTYKPVKERVDGYYQQNAEEKQKLIDKASQLQESDDISDAAQQAKALQASWKKIGFAGRKKDSALWKSFREANDAIFAAKQTEFAAKKAESDAKAQEVTSLLDGAKAQLEGCSDAAQLSEWESSLANIDVAIEELPPKQQGKYSKQVKTLRDKKDARANAWLAEKRLSKRQALFDEMVSGASQGELASLLPGVKTKLSDELSDEKDLLQDRRRLTVLAELVAQLPTPDSDASLRTELQFSLMQWKLEKGHSFTPESILQAWVECGDVSEEDGDLVTRLRVVWLGEAQKINSEEPA